RAWLDELGAGMIRIRGLRALLGPAVGSGPDGGPDGGPGCCDPLLGAAELLVGAARRAGELRPDVEAVDVLRLVHGVAAASELADGDGGKLRRYGGLLVPGLATRPRAWAGEPVAWAPGPWQERPAPAMKGPGHERPPGMRGPPRA